MATRDERSQEGDDLQRDPRRHPFPVERSGPRHVAGEAYRTAPWLVLAVGGAAAFPLAKTIIESFDGSQSFFRRAGNAYGMPLLYVRGIVVGCAWYALGSGFFRFRHGSAS